MRCRIKPHFIEVSKLNRFWRKVRKYLTNKLDIYRIFCLILQKNLLFLYNHIIYKMRLYKNMNQVVDTYILQEIRFWQAIWLKKQFELIYIRIYTKTCCIFRNRFSDLGNRFEGAYMWWIRITTKTNWYGNAWVNLFNEGVYNGIKFFDKERVNLSFSSYVELENKKYLGNCVFWKIFNDGQFYKAIRVFD